MAPSRPLEAACERLGGGLYTLHDSWDAYQNELYHWGEDSARKAAA